MVEVTWKVKMLEELKVHLFEPLIMFCDNISDGYLAKHPMYQARVKHIEIDFCFVCEKVVVGAMCCL